MEASDVRIAQQQVIFFRALKQDLRVKSLVGTSANALRIQIWTALIAILLLKYLELRASIGWSLSFLIPSPSIPPAAALR